MESLSVDSLVTAPRRTSSLFIIVILIAITLGVFWRVSQYDFINYDDDKYVSQNPHLRDGLSLKGIQWAFSADFLFDSPHADYWQPVTFLSRMLDVTFYGLNPAGHHLTNLLFHTLNVLLLFNLLSEMTGAPGRSAFVAALFAVHPLQVEPVAWITARKDLLSTFFGILTIRAYRDSLLDPSFRAKVFVVFLFSLSLMSKPVLVTLPFVLVLLDYWPLGRVSPAPFQWAEWGKVFREKGPLFALAALFSAIHFIKEPGFLSDSPAKTILSNTFIRSVRYLGKVLYPVRLALNCQPPDTTFYLWRMLGAAILLTAVSLLVIWQARRRPYLMVGWGWYLAMLIPTIGNLSRIESRFMYLAIVGLFLMFVWGISEELAKRRQGKTVLAVSAVILVSALASRAHAQVSYWKNSITLFEHAVETIPGNNYIAHNQLCAAWLAEGNVGKALAHCSKALQLKPDAPEIHYNFSLVLALERKPEEAILHYKEALRLKPDYVAAHTNLGVALVAQGKRREALPHFREALRLNPDSAEAHYNLGIALEGQGKREEAVVQYHEALRLKPHSAEAHYNLANAFLKQGKSEAALSHLKETLRLRPDFFEAHVTLGVLLAEKGKPEEGLAHLKEALRLEPDSAEAHNNLANVLELEGKREEAILHYKEALRLKPNSPYFRRNLGVTLARQGKLKEAEKK